jgi:hypothetical protein
MKKLTIAGGLALGLSVLAGAVWLRAAPAPTVGTLAVNPAYVVINTPTAVTFTISITDPTLLPNGVNLLKTDANGKTIANVGFMRDDGINGDALAGDRVYSYRVALNVAVAARSYFRASAAFKGVLVRVQSNVASILPAAQATVTNAILAYPAAWTVTNGQNAIIVQPPGISEGNAITVATYRTSPGTTLSQWIDETFGQDFILPTTVRSVITADNGDGVLQFFGLPDETGDNAMSLIKVGDVVCRISASPVSTMRVEYDVVVRAMRCGQ